MIQRGLSFGETPIRVSNADARVRSVYLRDLPEKASDDDVSSFFNSFCEVLSVKRSTVDDFPVLYNDNRVVKIALDSEVPYFVRVHDFPCRAWYAGQLPQCFVYRKFGHRASDCPQTGVVISPVIWLGRYRHFWRMGFWPHVILCVRTHSFHGLHHLF